MIRRKRLVALLIITAFTFFGNAQKSNVKRIAKRYPGLKNDILHTKPDYIVYVPQEERNQRGDTYNDHFHVFYGVSGVLFAMWTQASDEGHLDQHVVFSKSYDEGMTWEHPIVIAGSETVLNRREISSWQIPMVSEKGRIYVLWNQQEYGQTGLTGQLCGWMYGRYSDDEGETWSDAEKINMPIMDSDKENPSTPPDWAVWQKPLRLGKNEKYLVGLTRHAKVGKKKRYRTSVEFIQFNNIDEHPEISELSISWFMTNENVLEVPSDYGGATCEEPSIVKLPDNRLFALLRTGTGYPYWSQSIDNGITWMKPKPLLDKDGGKPFLQPISPCPIYDWKGNEAGSGYYYAFLHNRFDFKAKSAYQNRGPVYLIAGTFQKDAEQPIWFGEPKIFINRPAENSLYSSSTVSPDGKNILWYNDKKHYLLGKIIDEKWFEEAPPLHK
ncbi:MAG: sialidase family protein [Croceivirga sp.]